MDDDRADEFWEASSLSSLTAAAWGARIDGFEPADGAAVHPLVAGAAEVPLAPVDDRFHRRLAARGSGRSFGPEPLPQRAVERVLAAVGPTADGRRLVPEAGSIDVVHAYAVLRRVDGPLAGAIVRYDHRRHTAQPVGPVPDDDVLRSTLLLDVEALPQAVLVFVVDLGEVTRKYGPRSTRFALQQVGHAAQNASLRVAHDGLDGYLLGGGLDREVLAMLRIGHVGGIRYGGAYAFGR